MKMFLIIVITVLLIAEVIILRDLEKSNSKVRNKINWFEYKLERRKYKAYVMKEYVSVWKRIEDIGKLNLAITIDFRTNNLFVLSSKYIEKNNKKYRKLYIIDGESIRIVYLENNYVIQLKRI